MSRGRFAVNNLLLKLVALVLAVMCWFYARWIIGMEEQYRQRELSGVEIKVLEPPGRVSPAKRAVACEFAVSPPVIDLVVGGSRRGLEELVPGRVLALVDVSELRAKAGHANITMILPVKVILPAGVRLVSPERPQCEVTMTVGAAP